MKIIKKRLKILGKKTSQIILIIMQYLIRLLKHKFKHSLPELSINFNKILAES